MSLESFYSVLAGACFTLIGLWWAAMQIRQDWLEDEKLRQLAGGIYLAFLLPGAMSLGAQIGGENKLVWRSIFAVTSVIAIFALLRLMRVTSGGKTPGTMHSMRWLLVLIYVVVLILAINPDLVKPLGLSALQVESFLLTLLVLGGHGLAWELLSKPRVREAEP
jgi:predicted transporter